MTIKNIIYSKNNRVSNRQMFLACDEHDFCMECVISVLCLL